LSFHPGEIGGGCRGSATAPQGGRRRPQAPPLPAPTRSGETFVRRHTTTTTNGLSRGQPKPSAEQQATGEGDDAPAHGYMPRSPRGQGIAAAPPCTRSRHSGIRAQQVSSSCLPVAVHGRRNRRHVHPSAAPPCRRPSAVARLHHGQARPARDGASQPANHPRQRRRHATDLRATSAPSSSTAADQLHRVPGAAAPAYLHRRTKQQGRRDAHGSSNLAAVVVDHHRSEAATPASILLAAPENEAPVEPQGPAPPSQRSPAAACAA
jgi:hypothetical protein